MPRASKKSHETGQTITTPSWLGSHASMVVTESEEFDLENTPEGLVVCKDDRGEYVTYADRLDNGLANPCRFAARD